MRHTNDRRLSKKTKKELVESCRFDYLPSLNINGTIFKVSNSIHLRWKNLLFTWVNNRDIINTNYNFTENERVAFIDLKRPGWIAMTRDEAIRFTRKEKLTKLNNLVK